MQTATMPLSHPHTDSILCVAFNAPYIAKDVGGKVQCALELESETIGGTHPVAASTLVQIGKYHYKNQSYDDAEGCIRKSITIIRNALGPLHPQVSKTTLLLASIYERHGLNDIAPRGESKENVELELYVDAL